MASADLREELSCSICLDLYTEPVSLECGHNFCRDCIGTVLDAPERPGEYSCPVCKKQYTERPLLEINRKLCNMVDHFRYAHQEVLCTYCDSPVPATKTCLHCEASFCEKHLSNHSKSPHHVLTDPTPSIEDKKCSTHREILKYYCTEDSACICMSCWVAGDHRGHQVELLNEASEKKFRDVIEKLNSKRKETEITIQNVEDQRTREKGKAADFAEKIAKLFECFRKELDDVEERVLTEISREEEHVSRSGSDLIHLLEAQQDELSRNIEEIEDLHKITDPLTFLKKELISDDIISKNDDMIVKLKNAGDLDWALLSEILTRGLLNFTNGMMEATKNLQEFSELKKSDILLDTQTPNNYAVVTKEPQPASCSNNAETRPESPERAKAPYELGLKNFTSGRHYWEADVSAAEEWNIEVVCLSLKRKPGVGCYPGFDGKTWLLTQGTCLQVKHRESVKNIDSNSSLKTVGIYLDYDAGRLSFYQMCNPIRHLHTFTTTFKETRYTAFQVESHSKHHETSVQTLTE